MNKKVLLVFLIMFMLFASVACTLDIVYADPTVVSVAVSGIKKVDDYIVGDAIDIVEATLIATYSNGKIEEIPLEYTMLDTTSFNMSFPEENKKITVIYKGASTYFYITVLDLNFESVSLVALPDKLVYIEGEKVVSSGAFIGVHYTGGKTVKVAVADKMLQTYNNTILGEQDIMISYYGNPLSFTVNFLPKTVKAISVLREPLQNTVFKNFGDDLSLAGMKLKLFYDNGLTPEMSVVDIADSVKVYLDDSNVKTVIARVAYLPANYLQTVVYDYLGNAMVSVGDYVYPDLALASNLILDDVKSKTYGKVTSIAENKIIVSTIVAYPVTTTAIKVGQIVLDGELLGKYGSNTVFCIGGGVISAVAGGVITVQTAPTSSFNINVKDRSYSSMEILTYPKTKINETDTRTQSIIQGDTLDLETGKVRVYFDNNETADLPMNSRLIKVINSTDDMQRKEIPNLTFNSIDDIEGLGEGRYQLLYEVTHSYGDSGVTIVVSVIDEEGNDVYVQENRYVSLNLAKNYTVSITVSRLSEGRTLVSECSYHLSTIGAGVRHRQLDISAAGRHSLMVVYGGVNDNSVKFTVSVSQKTPVQLILDDYTNNISNATFYKGNKIPLTTLRYKIVYNNGDESIWTGVTTGMLGEGCSLDCDTITDAKIIFFTVIGSPNVKSADLYCKVLAMPIVSVALSTLPDNIYLTATAGGGNDIDLSGGVLSIYYKNNKVETIGNTLGGEVLTQLLNVASGRRIELNYVPAGGGDIPSTAFTPEQIYNGTAQVYTAILTYYDADGASASTTLNYYIYYIPGENKSVDKITADYRVGQYVQEYIQCEDWDLTGIKLIVTYSNGTTSTIIPTVDMIYRSTTNNIGKNIPLMFTYLGKVYSGALNINVSNRLETAINVKSDGKNTYFTTDRNIDLSTYRFTTTYNAGPNEEIIGITTFNGGLTKEGWWYQLTDLAGTVTVLNREGKKIIKLMHTTIVEGNYLIVTCDIPIEVFVNNTPIASIEYIPEVADSFYNQLHNGLPILAEVASGWQIMFSDFNSGNNSVFNKVLTIHYTDGTTGYVEFSSTMLNYNINDLTKGYRRVTITYKTYFTCEVYVEVKNATLIRVEVETKPVTNFIAGSNLNLVGGILKLTYSERLPNDDIRFMYKYIDMDNGEVAIAGYNSNIDPDIDHQVQTINLTYKGHNASYNVTVYNKQNVVFQYQNTIFFYGRTKNASVQAFRAVPEFVLPSISDINMYYVCSIYFMEQSEITLYLQQHPDRAINNILKIIVGYTEEGEAIYKYVDEKFIFSSYFYAPAPRGYDYYILMTVRGNTYYKDANYCIKKYTIIPKVVLVSSINATEYAYVYRIKTGNIAATVLYLYSLNFDNVRSNFSQFTFITGLEMVSPNKDYLEILLSVNNAYVEDETNLAGVKSVFAYIKNLIETNVVMDKNLPIEQQVNVSVSNYDTVSVDGITRGVNISEFEGGKPSFVSYRLDKGETLTLGGVMDLLENSLGLNVIEGNYGIGTYRTTVGTLSHNNYNIDFSASNYIVTKRIISGYFFNQGTVSGSFENNDLQLNITTSQTLSLTLMYVTGRNGKTSDTIQSNDYKIKYYLLGVLQEGMPTEMGIYDVVIVNCYANTLGDISLNFTLVIS